MITLLENMGHILYHVLIVIFPVHIYYFLAIRNNGSSTGLQGKLLGMTILILLLTMSFPVSYANGFIYDFRIIPIMVSFVYIGFFQGISTILTMMVYLYFLGDLNLPTFLVNYTIITIIFYFIGKKFKSLTLKNKLLIITAIFWFLTITRSITLIKMGELDHLYVMVFFSMITWVTLMLVILLINNLRQQIMLQMELRRSEKLNVISQLAASVAHEVRNPMTTINGFLQLMKMDDNLTIKQRSYIDISLAELTRAQEIINDYLSLAKPNINTEQVVNVSEQLNKTIDLMTSYTNIQNIKVTSAIEEQLFIRGNTDEIKQVFINIIKNGIEAISSNGKLHINAFAENNEALIIIKDNGGGMTKEQLSKIGTPFYSTKEKGTGVGLTISFQIIAQMKGKIDINSVVGKGTTFLIKLPLHEINTNEPEITKDKVTLIG